MIAALNSGIRYLSKLIVALVLKTVLFVNLYSYGQDSKAALESVTKSTSTLRPQTLKIGLIKRADGFPRALSNGHTQLTSQIPPPQNSWTSLYDDLFWLTRALETGDAIFTGDNIICPLGCTLFIEFLNEERLILTEQSWLNLSIEESDDNKAPKSLSLRSGQLRFISPSSVENPTTVKSDNLLLVPQHADLILKTNPSSTQAYLVNGEAIAIGKDFTPQSLSKGSMVETNATTLNDAQETEAKELTMLLAPYTELEALLTLTARPPAKVSSRAQKHKEAAASTPIAPSSVETKPALTAKTQDPRAKNSSSSNTPVTLQGRKSPPAYDIHYGADYNIGITKEHGKSVSYALLRLGANLPNFYQRLGVGAAFELPFFSKSLFNREDFIPSSVQSALLTLRAFYLWQYSLRIYAEGTIGGSVTAKNSSREKVYGVYGSGGGLSALLHADTGFELRSDLGMRYTVLRHPIDGRRALQTISIGLNMLHFF